ncbi:MAG: pyridoxamine 5'-phosphate oxidase family protein [Dehalococcoidia bacterium]
MGETYENEREAPQAASEALRGEVQKFITQWNQVPSFMMTFRKDGRPIMRPVSTFVDGWMVGTITQHLHVKTQHIRDNPVVGYLWVGRDGRGPGMDWAPKSVWLQGRAELIEDPAEVEAFFERRKEKLGAGDAHPTDHDYRRIVVRVTPEYLRAEGFYEAARPVIIRDFSY